MATIFFDKNAELENLLQEYERKENFSEPERYFKPNFKKKCLRADMRSSNVGNLLGISEVFDAYSFCKNFCNSLQFREAKKLRKFSRASQVRFSDSQI